MDQIPPNIDENVTATFTAAWWDADEVRRTLQMRPQLTVRESGFLRKTFTVTGHPRIVHLARMDLETWRDEEAF